MSLTTELQASLTPANLTSERFMEIATRLLTWGVLVRNEDRTEQLLYDDARRIESLLAEYFEVLGMRLYHEVNTHFFRLYAPGAAVDGLAPDSLAPVPSLKARVSSDFVAAALALRCIYQTKLDQGLINDQGEALISFEELSVTLLSQLRRSLPETNTERLALLAELKRHRLLRYSSNFSVTDEDAYLAIRPTILGIVNNDSLAAALAAEEKIKETVQVLEETEEKNEA